MIENILLLVRSQKHPPWMQERQVNFSKRVELRHHYVLFNFFTSMADDVSTTTILPQG